MLEPPSSSSPPQRCASPRSPIDSIRAEGGTNIDAGLRAVLEELRDALGVRRLVLAFDGHPSVGVTDPFN